MIQDIAPAVYNNDYKMESPKDSDPILIFGGMKKREDKVLLKQTEIGLIAPTWKEVREEAGEAVEILGLQFLFSVDETSYYMLKQYQPLETSLTFGEYSYQPVRMVRTMYPKVLCFAVMTGYHLFDWYRSNRFCGYCGQPTVAYERERALKCTCCGNLIYPKICPAVIVGIRNKDKIVLSQYANRGPVGKTYALIAGFCEIGETAEETVQREAMEEVGLKVKNITYYKSQPWGFDANLLLGFFCDVDGDDQITMDENELATAAFFSRDEIPYAGNQVTKASLTATMIEAFREENYEV